MNINSNSIQNSNIHVYQQQAQKADLENAGLDKNQNNSTGHGGDAVKFSEDAMLMADAIRTAQSTSNVHNDKVSTLKAQVTNGTYQTDNDKIAQGIVKQELNMYA